MQKKLVIPDCKECGFRSRSIFCNLEQGDLNELNSQKGFISLKKGHNIFTQGMRPQSLFCIYTGKVKIHQLGNDGKDQIVRFAKEGDIVGYRALISGENYSSSATVLEDSVICLISRKTFFSLLEKNHKLSLGLLNLLSHDLEKAEHRITDLAQKPVKERLSESLLVLRETYGCEIDGATLNVALSREELANLVGTARETVIRLLSEFNSQHIIELDGKKIRILNLRELQNMANVFD